MATDLSRTGKTIPIELGARSYDVHIASGILDNIQPCLHPHCGARRQIWISDEQVAGIYWDQIDASAQKANIRASLYSVPAGEASKSWAQLEALCEWLLEQQVERGDHIIALGGGVIGDLAGFAASIVKRGCNFIQIPTSLLAQVDSSVGGKTAINSRIGKNLIGSFHQPAMVLIDPGVLDTLEPRHMRAGYAEVVKYGLIGDAGFFDWCEENGEQVLARSPDALTHAIATSVAAKARIVGLDEFERKGQRALLNLGHTFGHALEAETGFGDKLLHGEAVAAGMVLAYRYSVRKGLCTQAAAERVEAHIRACGLPASPGEAGICCSGARLVEHMRHDKKMSGSTLPFILVRDIGAAFVDSDVDLEDVAAFLDTEMAQ